MVGNGTCVDNGVLTGVDVRPLGVTSGPIAQRRRVPRLYGCRSAAATLHGTSLDEATPRLPAADFAFELGEQTLDGQIGLRYVNVDTDMVFGDGSASASASKLLPSLMLRYAFTPNLMLRGAYGETLRRPAFNQLNPNIIYVEDVTNIGYGTASGGNPGLAPTESKNYDLGLEWYFSPGSAVYATLFRREIEGMVTDFRRRATFENYDYILSQPDNASNGELEGLELGVVWFPENLPGLLDGFGVQASYTALDSTGIPGQHRRRGRDTVSTRCSASRQFTARSCLRARHSVHAFLCVARRSFTLRFRAVRHPLVIYFNAEKSRDCS